jgi:hypothetical protein
MANPHQLEIRSTLDRIGTILARQQRMRVLARTYMEMSMANEQDIRGEIAHLRQLIAADQQGDQDAIDALVSIRNDLTAKVAELQKQIDAGTPPTVDFDGILGDLTGLETLIVANREVPPVTTPISDPTVPPGETPVPSA